MASDNRPVILIVDDDPTVLKLLGQQLEGIPAKIIPTTSPAEAIHLLKSLEVAILMCDLNMPDISGNAVLITAREANPNIVSIVITAGAGMEQTIRAINEGGIWKYVEKPWQMEKMVQHVKDGLKRSSMLHRRQKDLNALGRDVREETCRLAAQEDPARKPLIIKAAPKTSAGAPPSSGKPQIRIVKKGASATISPAETFAGQDAGPAEDPKEIRLVRKKNAPSAERPSKASQFASEFESERYRLVDVLGESAMGVVYRAEDSLLSCPVAIKVLSKKFSRDEKALAALHERARQAMQISHKHIVRLHGLEEAGPRFCLIMELVEGQSFREVLKLYHKLPLPTVLQIGKVCADSLACVHRQGMVHGDIKPSNLLLTGDGVLKITDIGDGLLADTHKGDLDPATFYYMSPERLRGEPLTAQADIYSLGMILHELVTGDLPFPEELESPRILEQGPQNLGHMPPEVSELLRKALEANVEDRWDSAETFSRALFDIVL